MSEPRPVPELTAEEQTALAEAHRDGGSCPEVDELIRWVGSQDSNERLERHLLTCPECQELVERLSLSDPEIDDLNWKKIEYSLDQRSGPWREPGTDSGNRRLLALAATVLLALLLPVLWMLSQPSQPPSTFRGSPIQQLEPAGVVSELESFRWNVPPSSMTFRVVVQDSGGREIWQATSSSNRLREVASLMALLEPGRTYRWRVEGEDPQGRVLAQSEWLEFSVAQ